MMIRRSYVLAPAVLAALVLAVLPLRAQGYDPSDVVVRLEQLQNQMRQMTGAIEQLQYRNQQLEQQLRRLQEEQGGRAASPAPAAPSAAPVPGRRSDVYDPAQQPNAPGAPRPLGGAAGGTVGGVPMIAREEPSYPVGAPGGRDAGAPLDLSTLSREAAAGSPPSGNLPFNTAPAPAAVGTTTAPPSNTPKDEYDLAYGYVLRKDYGLAENTFRNFLKKYPDDRLTADAQYWLGETLYQRQRYQDAADSFLVVVRNHDKSGKAPDALLRLGQSLAAIGQKEMACASLNEVNRKYPRASASVKRGVEQAQKRAKC
ncbi:MAG TPA: tol-pal system protein YbgF [Pseudolabrys sp.]|nr:tol-pal system protein YbgF [Pseudolabrys sp.]